MSGASPANPDPDRHIVVFDCNVYLDVARTVGQPFTWDAFDEAVVKTSTSAVPHPDGAHLDSIRAIAMCTSGLFAGDATIEVWTNAHIDKVVRYKAMESTEPDPETGHYGLGWSEDEAQGLVDLLVVGITTASSGGTLGSGHFPDSNPPLDHEDGMVFGACRFLAGADPLATVYCITRDQGFLDDYRNGRLSDHSRVLTPSQFVALMRAARLKYSMGRMGR